VVAEAEADDRQRHRGPEVDDIAHVLLDIRWDPGGMTTFSL
jgi:hypothetical protein